MLNLLNYLLIFPASTDTNSAIGVEVETDIEEDIEDEEEDFDDFLNDLEEDLEILKGDSVKNQEIMLDVNNRLERLEQILKSIFKKGEN
jgi:hypothetical protein